MGYMCHHAIIVTGWREEDVMAAHQKACEFFKGILHVSEITPEVTNGYISFLIPPDGSKEGWDTSYRGDIARNRFIRWLSSQKDNWCEYAEVQFGDEEGNDRLLRSRHF